MSEIIKRYLFAFQNDFYSTALEQAFYYFQEFLYKISKVSHDHLKDELSLNDKDNYDKNDLILYSEYYQKRYLINLYNISTNDFEFLFIIYFLHYLNQYENSVFKDKFIKEISQNNNSFDFFEELYNLLSFVEKNKDYQQERVKVFFTNEFKSRSIDQIIENIKNFLNDNPNIELNIILFVFIERLNLFNKLFKDKMHSIKKIIQVLRLFQKEEWSNSLTSILIYPNDDYDVNEEELKTFLRLYWVYYTLNKFKKHLKIFTTDYFYHKKNENNKISKAEEIAQSHYLLYLRQFLDKGNDEHKIIDHEKHFGNSRYDILIDEFEGFPPFIIECKFTVENITENQLNEWIVQIVNYIKQYNSSYDKVQINDGLLLVFHNNKCNLNKIDILENIDNELYKIKQSTTEFDLYLYSVNID